jgi:DNA-binding NarL/FixJ family response regulator
LLSWVLIQALQQVMDANPFSLAIYRTCIPGLVAEEDLAGVDPLNPLTRREREIFHLTINGIANTEISEGFPSASARWKCT